MVSAAKFLHNSEFLTHAAAVAASALLVTSIGKSVRRLQKHRHRRRMMATTAMTNYDDDVDDCGGNGDNIQG